jgi:succinate-acetate transporter protein
MVETIVEARKVITNIKDKTANPTPLGFTGLGLSAVLLVLAT